ncbi:hypothetical protein [Streptomyces sp. NPDC019507]|uniref:hypothetical protein n=1 Tax=Streptomyces sp. NPDC019507 TaxID=3154689 RepID=UPI003406A884
MNEPIECPATRRGRSWSVSSPEHGVYGHGRTLKMAKANLEEGLAVIGVFAEVTIVPVMPELEKLRAADRARAEALAEAVEALALRRASMRDIATVTDAPMSHVKALLASLKAAWTKDADGASASEAEPGNDERTCDVSSGESPASGGSFSGQRHVHPAASGRLGGDGPCPEHSDAPGGC